MRNLKKVLSLTLALVMLLGMMVVGAGAAEYTDAGEIEYKEAAEVMSAIGVFNGMDGKFNPQGNLTRAQAAKIITYMVLGQAVADKLPNDNSKFSDCPNGEWYVGSVNYLSDTGIVAGQGDGTFNPEGNVTGVEFAKMLLGILGYDAKTEKFENDPSWAANIALRARQAGLDADMTTQTVNSVALTRDQASQMAFNTLTATMVGYVGGTDVTTPDGTVIKVGGTLTPIRNETGSGNKGQYNYYYDGIMQFCEQYFPGLKLASANTAETDAFGRRVNVWKLDNQTICEASTWEADVTFTAEVKDADVKTAIGKATGRDQFTDSDGNVIPATELVVNGKATRPGDDVDAEYIAGLTGNGRLVEIYLTDDLTAVFQVVVVDTVVGTVTKVDTKKETITIALKDTAANTAGTTLTTDVGYGEFEKDDVVLVTAAADDDAANGTITGKFSVVTVAAAEEIVGIASRLNKTNKTITVGGEIYTVAGNNAVDLDTFTLDAENDATLYLDGNGYIVFAKAGAKADTTPKDKLVALTENYTSLVDGKLVYMGSGVLSDGTTVEMNFGTTNPSYTENLIYTYDNTTTPGKYALSVLTDNTVTAASYYIGEKTVNTDDILKTHTKGVSDATNYFYASDVKFIFVKSNKATVVNGVQAVTCSGSGDDGGKTLAWALKDVNGQKVISAVMIEAAAPAGVGASEDIIYVDGGAKESNLIDGKIYYTYDAYLDGEPVEDFYAADGGETGFYYKTVDEKTGAHKFVACTTGVVESSYAVANNGANVITLEDGPTDVTLNDNTNYKDLTDNGLESAAAIIGAMGSGNVKVAVVLGANNVAKTVYVTHVGSEKMYTPNNSSETKANVTTNLDEGVYVLSDVWSDNNSSGNHLMGNGDKPTDSRVIIFTVKTAIASGSVTVQIMKGDTVVYSEVNSGLTKGAGDKMMFWTQVTGSNINRWGAGGDNSSGKYDGEYGKTADGAQTAFASGTYTYKITTSNTVSGAPEVLATGSFSVE